MPAGLKRDQSSTVSGRDPERPLPSASSTPSPTQEVDMSLDSASTISTADCWEEFYCSMVPREDIWTQSMGLGSWSQGSSLWPRQGSRDEAESQGHSSLEQELASDLCSDACEGSSILDVWGELLARPWCDPSKPAQNTDHPGLHKSLESLLATPSAVPSQDLGLHQVQPQTLRR